MKFLPDLIACYPKHLTYPLWHQYICENRGKFNKVIIIFTDMGIDLDYSMYVRELLKNYKIIFENIARAKAGEDWRNKAINEALLLSTSEWVYFTEEDFFPKEGFWKEVTDLAKRCEVFGFFQESRLHPCCIFIKRELLNKTSKNFSVIKDELDHFGRVQRDLEKKDIIMGVIFSRFGHHMNGLSQNMFLLQTGGEPNYEPEKFKEYCEKCLGLPNHPDFVTLFRQHIGGD